MQKYFLKAVVAISMIVLFYYLLFLSLVVIEELRYASITAVMATSSCLCVNRVYEKE